MYINIWEWTDERNAFVTINVDNVYPEMCAMFVKSSKTGMNRNSSSENQNGSLQNDNESLNSNDTVSKTGYLKAIDCHNLYSVDLVCETTQDVCDSGNIGVVSLPEISPTEFASS